ncbi:MAG: transposase [Leptolyngbyaceae cyanobacterium RU_5_1]|nr:transposase [Leptolyngbyaceae cyanobacterium RU_5_1]
MRELSKPSTARCNGNLYTLFLLAEPQYVSCVRLSGVLEQFEHDSVNRFLLRENYTPQDRFEAVKGELIFAGGTASVDDSVVDKPYRDPSKSAFVGYFWSGKHKRSVKGVNLITLYYSDVAGNSYPVNFRIYDQREGKTKNDYFLDMVREIKQWGLKPDWVSGDSWYASLENLKFLRNEEVGFLFGVAHNRKVSLERGKEVPVQTLEIPQQGLVVYLKEFGWVKVFRQDFKHEARYYIMMLPELENLKPQESLKHLTRQTFKQVHDQHWQIESFHRVIKQVCNLERFYVRDEQAIRNHFFCALQAFCRLQTMRVEGLIENLYEVSRQLFIPVIRQFILENLTNSVSG